MLYSYTEFHKNQTSNNPSTTDANKKEKERERKWLKKVGLNGDKIQPEFDPKGIW